jgi:hypothetical protein
MAEHKQDVPTCGICSEPFNNGDVAVQAARWNGLVMGGYGPPLLREEKFWAHPMCLFSIARETEGPESRVAAMPECAISVYVSQATPHPHHQEALAGFERNLARRTEP